MTEKSDAEVRENERAEDAHERERVVLFGNETFFPGMLQAVSGASLFAALSQWQALADHRGRLVPLYFLTLMGAALASAVLAAYWKHQYKMWDVKAGASDADGRASEATKRWGRAGCYLRAMRLAMLISVISIFIALVGLLLAAWARVLCTYVQ